jgi:hypothetical protein
LHGIQDEIREVGALPRMLELLRTCMDSSSLVVTVVKALSVLAHSNHANMETVFRLGGVPLLLEMLSPKIGPVSNAAAADLIRVLCSNELCQQNILRNQGLQVQPLFPNLYCLNIHCRKSVLTDIFDHRLVAPMACMLAAAVSGMRLNIM